VTIKARFKGQEGYFYNGVPARDLSEEEYEELTEEQKRMVRTGPLYTMVDNTKKDDKDK
jgi:hypothetical protein